jgi:hypothetical protein
MWWEVACAGTYVNEHGFAELFNQMLDLCCIEGCLLFSLDRYGMARFVLLKAAYILQVAFKTMH